MQGPSTSLKGPKKVPKAGERPSFVLGSRPETLRSPTISGSAPRIKPMAGQTQYGKAPATNAVAGFSPFQGPMG